MPRCTVGALRHGASPRPDGNWYSGKILKVLDNNRVKVKYGKCRAAAHGADGLGPDSTVTRPRHVILSAVPVDAAPGPVSFADDDKSIETFSLGDWEHKFLGSATQEAEEPEEESVDAGDDGDDGESDDDDGSGDEDDDDEEEEEDGDDDEEDDDDGEEEDDDGDDDDDSDDDDDDDDEDEDDDDDDDGVDTEPDSPKKVKSKKVRAKGRKRDPSASTVAASDPEVRVKWDCKELNLMIASRHPVHQVGASSARLLS